jgi:hypothetical protein
LAINFEDKNDMKKPAKILLIIILHISVVGASADQHTSVVKFSLSQSELNAIGKKIWENEAKGSIAGLTHWNKSEGFASLGIGHFIWFPKDKKFPFKESFPQLIAYMQSERIDVPNWLIGTPCPWQSHEEFVAETHSKRMKELRVFLAGTFKAQLKFIVHRSQRALEKMVLVTKLEDQNRLRENYSAMASSPQGLYALIDYTNFKGEGILKTEKYNGEGWGLKDVLLGMNDNEKPIREFSLSAQKVLRRRVANGPVKEGRWLTGWLNRCKEYEQPIF